jgi:hypothetical protein
VSQDTIEQALLGRGAQARTLTPTPSQVSAAVSAVRRKEDRSRRTILRSLPAPAVGLAALVLGGAGALAATQALNPDFAAFLDGGQPPGRVLAAGEGPAWIEEAEQSSASNASVIATSGAHHLYAYRDSEGSVCFGFDESYGECSPPSYYRNQLAKGPIMVLGPLYDDHGQSATKGSLFGYVDSSVARLRLDLPGRPAEIVAAENGAFIVPVDLLDRPTQLVGLGADGAEVGSVDLTQRLAGERKGRL